MPWDVNGNWVSNWPGAPNETWPPYPDNTGPFGGWDWGLPPWAGGGGGAGTQLTPPFVEQPGGGGDVIEQPGGGGGGGGTWSGGWLGDLLARIFGGGGGGGGVGQWPPGVNPPVTTPPINPDAEAPIPGGANPDPNTDSNGGTNWSNILGVGGDIASTTNQILRMLGGLNAGQLRSWLQAAQVGALNRSEQQYGGILNYLMPQTAGVRDAAMGMFGPMGELYRGQVPGMTEDLASRRGDITQLARDTGMYTTPGMENAQMQLGNIAGGLGPLGALAQQGFAGGGWTPQYQGGYDQLFGMLERPGPAQAALADVGPNLLGQRGQNQWTTQAQQALSNAMGVGGMTPALGGLQQGGMGLFSGGGRTPGLDILGQAGMQGLGGSMGVGGLTPTGAMGEQVALQGLQAGGATPFTQGMTSRGMGLASREALLPMDMAISAAGDMAAGKASDFYEQAMRRAKARGGGPGPVRGGLQNRGIAEYADQSARLVADAERQAMMGQQGLQLQQMETGAGMAQSAAALENARLGTFAGLLGGMENVAAGRWGAGGGMMSDAEQIALSRMGLGAQTGIGAQNAGTGLLNAYAGPGNAAMQAEIARMGLGGDLSNMYTQNQLGALGTMGTMMGNQNQYALGLGNLGLGTGTAQGNLYNQQFGNWLGGGQLGNQRFGNIAGAWGQADANRINQMGQVGNMWGTGMGAMNPVTSGLFDLAGNWARSYGGMFQNPNYNVSNTWG